MRPPNLPELFAATELMRSTPLQTKGSSERRSVSASKRRSRAMLVARNQAPAVVVAVMAPVSVMNIRNLNLRVLPPKSPGWLSNPHLLSPPRYHYPISLQLPSEIEELNLNC